MPIDGSHWNTALDDTDGIDPVVPHYAPLSNKLSRWGYSLLYLLVWCNRQLDRTDKAQGFPPFLRSDMLISTHKLAFDRGRQCVCHASKIRKPLQKVFCGGDKAVPKLYSKFHCVFDVLLYSSERHSHGSYNNSEPQSITFVITPSSVVNKSWNPWSWCMTTAGTRQRSSIVEDRSKYFWNKPNRPNSSKLEGI